MTIRWFKRGLPALALLGLVGPYATPAPAGFIEAEGVKALNADPSPTAARSHVDNYLFQPDQLNLDAKSGTIRVLRTDQKINVNDYDVAVIPLKHADRREIRNVLRDVTALEGGRAEVFTDKVGKTGTWVEVVAPKFMIPYLKDAIAELDVPWLQEYNDGATDLYIKVMNRKAADVDTIAAFYAGSEGSTAVDTTNNALRRYDEAFRNDEYAKAVKIVDIPCNQVSLDVKVYSVDASNDLKLGTDYVNWKNGPGRNLFDFAAAGYNSNQRARGVTSVFDPFLDARTFVYNTVTGKQQVEDVASNENYRSVNYLLPSSYIDFLQAKGEAKVVTTANLLLCSANTGTVSAQTSVLSFVNNTNEINEVPVSPEVITRSNNGGIEYPTAAGKAQASAMYGVPGAEVPLGGSPSYVQVADSSRRLHYTSAGTTGITMNLTPYVGLESMELDLDLQIGELNGVAPSGLPIINTRTVATTVRLLDGQPFVIAGLSRVHNSESSSKAPFLGSIPVVGYLFGGEQTLKRKDDMVITITPRFYLASQINMPKPPVVDTLQAIVTGEKDQNGNGVVQGAPALKLGFDQYIIGADPKVEEPAS